MSFARKISLFFRKSICNPRNRDYSKRIDKTRCQSGGIGRRAAFRSQWAYAREGSSPFSGTNFGKKNLCRTSTRFFFFALQARVAELADARDLGSRAARRAGSSPASRTIEHFECPALFAGSPPDEACRVALAGRGNSGESPAATGVPKVQGDSAKERRISQAKGKSANPCKQAFSPELTAYRRQLFFCTNPTR